MTVPGPVALVGSGEFLPQMVDVDRTLLLGRPARAVFLATAAGQEGDASVDRWLSLGVAHYTAMGVEPVAVRVVDRRDAEDPSFAALVAGAGLVYLSGGNPGYLADTLRDTPVWAAIVEAWRGGAALAGCSAGAMAITADAPHVRGGAMVNHAGLALVPQLSVVPHFDRMAQWDPGVVARATARSAEGATVVGIDEDTALVGGPDTWTVMGRQRVTVFGADGPTSYAAGAALHLSS
jgi:cyanophycinase